MFAFTIRVSVESDLSLDELRRFRDECHRGVSALTCYLKHARPADRAEEISTRVTSDDYVE